MAAPSNGYIKLSRRILDDRWWETGQPRSKMEAWIDLLFLARWAPGVQRWRGEDIPLQRGEFVASLRFLAERWGWSVKACRTFISEAIKLDRLRARERAHGRARGGAQSPTVYLVVNYSRYQANGGAAGTPAGKDGAAEGHKENTGRIQVEEKNLAPAARVAQEEEPDLPATGQPSSPSGGSWTAAAVALARRHGYFWPGGRITGALKPHVERDGWPWVERAWTAYLKSRPYLDWDIRAEQGTAKGPPVEDRRFVSPNDFATNYGLWDLRVTPMELVARKKELGVTGEIREAVSA